MKWTTIYEANESRPRSILPKNKRRSSTARFGVHTFVCWMSRVSATRNKPDKVGAEEHAKASHSAGAERTACSQPKGVAAVDTILAG